MSRRITLLATEFSRQWEKALAESVIGLIKTEEIHRDGPWRGFEDVEMATLEWVAWFNQERLLEPLGYVPPAEFEAHYYEAQNTHTAVGVLNETSLLKTRRALFAMREAQEAAFKRRHPHEWIVIDSGASSQASTRRCTGGYTRTRG